MSNLVRFLIYSDTNSSFFRTPAHHIKATKEPELE